VKCLNEPIARQANHEDRCSGHFWESRFISQPLLTEEALLSCMAYVDLNPVRAKLAETPEESDHTSIKERIQPRFNLATAIKNQPVSQTFDLPIKPLAHFEDSVNTDDQQGILFSMSDYLQLVDWTGRAVRNDKRGYINNRLPAILSRLKIPEKDWLQSSQHFERLFRRRFSRST